MGHICEVGILVRTISFSRPRVPGAFGTMVSERVWAVPFTPTPDRMAMVTIALYTQAVLFVFIMTIFIIDSITIFTVAIYIIL